METILSLEFILVITTLLLIWNLFSVHFIAKWVYRFLQRYKEIPAAYVSRKIVHISCGGVTAILIPICYEGYYYLVTIFAFGLAIYLLFRRQVKPLYWFQLEENKYEVHFAFAYGAILLLGVLLDNMMVGLIPLLFMSFGDSGTGLVRAVTQKRHSKSWEGSLAMLLICITIGFAFLGIYGIIVGTAATIIEKIPGIDDNVTVPIVTALLVYIQGLVL